MSDYAGYLIKTAHGKVPLSYFVYYKSTPNQETDEDSYSDANGVTHRNILPHTKSSISFQTGPLTKEEKEELQKHFPNRHRIVIEYWNEEDCRYTEGVFYIPPITYELKDASAITLLYKGISVEWIEL